MVTFQEGKIIYHGSYHEEAKYDLSNEVIAVTADGCGGLQSYRVANHAGNCLTSFLSLDLAVNGKRLSPYLKKTVEMIGRMQKIRLETETGELAVTTFLAKEVNGVFFLVEGKGLSLDLSLNCRGAKCERTENESFITGENFLLSSSSAGDWEAANDCFYTSASDSIRLLFSFSAEKEAHCAAFNDFDICLKECLTEIEKVKIPDSVQTEEEKALYLSAYFTALMNHKTVGNFRAFAAGINYLDPLRTYYRDSYFTVLPMLKSHPELVKDELLTLARGVGADGGCPSAVKSDFTAFWGDHYDSPSFFISELYDYVRATGDRAILENTVNGRSLYSLVRAILKRLSERTDETGLIKKEGYFNKRDWADEVNRPGYVTFVECLYYRALVAASRLFEKKDDSFASDCLARADKVKRAIDRLLFDAEKGYYVNYKTEDIVESNLSIDTLFALLFGVADEAKAQSVLDQAERLLETKNNAEQGGGDFGVMCVYPPYGLPKAACHKSARLYDYHNGANWCYLTAMYAYAKSVAGRDWRTPLLSTFRYMTSHGHFTPVEYFSPCCKAGSALQGWSAAIAFVYEYADQNFFA